MHHPHVHASSPAAVSSPDGSRWIGVSAADAASRSSPRCASLSRVFRGKFLALLKAAFAAGQLGFHGQLQPLGNPADFQRLLNQAVRHEWVVYAKRPFSSPLWCSSIWPLHAPRRHLQPPAGRSRRWSRELSLQGLRQRSARQNHDPGHLGVHPPLPDAHPTQGFRPHPLLRLPGQPPPPGEAGAVPGVARRGRDARNRPPDRPRIPSSNGSPRALPVLRRRHDPPRHRCRSRRPAAQSFWATAHEPRRHSTSASV